MADEKTPATEQGTGVPVDQIPTDFREYNRWRDTGELPQPPAGTPPATADTKSEPDPSGEPVPPVKTAPDSGTDDTQDTADDDATRKGSRERRIDRLTRENAELQRRLKALEDAAPPAARVDSPSTPPPPAGKPSTAKPDLANYKTLEDYTEALTDWKLDQREAKRQEAEAKATAEKAAQTQQESWSQREQAARKAHADYQELVESTPIPEGPGVMAARQALLEDDNGAEILYWLAKNPAELKRIAELSPVRAIAEIGKISAGLAPAPNGGAPDNPKPKVSSAPRPPSPIVHGTVKTADNVYDEDTARDFKRWSKARDAQLKG